MIVTLNGNKLEDPIILQNNTPQSYVVNKIDIQGDVTIVGSTFNNDGNIDEINTGIILTNE